MSDWKIVPKSDWTIVQPEPVGDSVEEGGPESFLHPDRFKPSPGRRPLKNTGSMADIRAQLAADKAATSPEAADAKGRAPIYSALDRASFGGLGQVMRLSNTINQATGKEPFYANDLDAIERYRSENPTISQITDAPAYFTAPTAGIARRADAAAVDLLERAPLAAREAIPGATALARVIGGAGGAGAVMSGINEGVAGGSAGDVARAMLHGGLDAATLGGGLAVGGRAAGGVGRAITESKGGKARQYLEKRGVEVGPGTPGRGGPMDTMVTRGAEDADIGQQAEASAKRGLEMLGEEKKAVLGGYGRRIGNIEQSPQAAQLRDVSDIVTNMRDAMNELDTSPQARAALGDLLKSVEAKQGAGFNADVDNYMLSEADVNKLRRQLDRYAKTGTSVDASLSPLKSAAGEARVMVDEGPFAEANADYSKQSKYYQKSRRLLGINERPRTPDETQAATNKVKNLITRRGQNTVTAGGQKESLAEFEARHPDIAEEFARPEILRKRADISFSLLPKHGGLIDRLTHGHQNVAALMAGLTHGATGLVPSLALMNMPAIQARLLYGPALAAQAAEPLLLGEIPQVAAARAAYGEDR